MNAKKEDYIFWMDFETTGLDENKDRPLELAVIITDIKFNQIGEPLVVLIKHSKLRTWWMRKKADPFVVKMHDDGGLWEQLPSGIPLKEAEAKVVAHIAKHVPEGARTVMGGNSVRLDANFLDKYFPKAAGMLGYRLFDVSSLGFVGYNMVGMKNFKKAKGHRALDDIMESIAEAKYLLADVI